MNSSSDSRTPKSPSPPGSPLAAHVRSTAAEPMFPWHYPPPPPSLDADPQEDGQPVSTLPPGDHWQRTELPPLDDDNDSALGSEAGSYRGSISESVLAYRTINGRRYHADRGNALFWAANDERHVEMTEIHYYAINDSIGGLYRAPIDETSMRRALDVGTGNGMWAIDFADLFPDCEVIGTDISPIQPTWVPPNVRFDIEDCTQPWSYADNSFDFVHIRLLYGSIPDWDFLFSEAYRVLKPGGWLESHECSPDLEALPSGEPLGPNNALPQWGKIFFEGGRRLGRTFRILHDDLQMKNFVRLGFQDITDFQNKVPVGGWPEDPLQRFIGRGCRMALDDAEGYVSFLASMIAGWTKEQVEAYCAHLRRELESNKYHIFYAQRVVGGRKPDV